MLKGQIKKDIEQQVDRIVGKWDGGVEVTRTEDARFGDYSTNVALKIVSSVKGHVSGEEAKNKQSLQDFAKVLADNLKDLPYFEKLEVAGPGFLNFWIKPRVLIKEVEKVLENRGKTQNENAENRRVIVEFTDPNPFKEFHIGHLYSNTVGEAISRLLEAQGAEVKRANYQGDVGMHVAKTIWGIPKLLEQIGERFEDIEKKPLKARAFFLGQAYALGSKEFEASDDIKKEIAEINKKIFELDPQVKDIYLKGRKWSLDYFEEIYKRLGTKFDFYYLESEVGKDGADLVRKYLKKGVFEESEGAIIFPGEKRGLHNRVFINSLGLPTYEAKELGLAPRKYQDFKYDQAIIVTGNEINDYFKVLLCALKEIYPDLAAHTTHIGHGIVRMPGGKMSSRLGNVILGEWLLDETKKRIQESYKEIDPDIAEKVAVGAVKYAFLKNNIGGDITFSFEESISLSGNSGPYLQYTYARCKSVLGKAEGIKGVDGVSFENTAKEEMLLLRHLGHFTEVIETAASTYSPNLLANYLYELAQAYNLFYNKHSILKAEGSERARRLFLTEATADQLKKGLYLLGIDAPEKM